MSLGNCSVADAIYKRKVNFLSKLHTDNILYTLFGIIYSNMAAEIAILYYIAKLL